MSDHTTGTGWICGACEGWVPAGETHVCSGNPNFQTTDAQIPVVITTDPLDRIIGLLERISAVLERKFGEPW